MFGLTQLSTTQFAATLLLESRALPSASPRPDLGGSLANSTKQPQWSTYAITTMSPVKTPTSSLSGSSGTHYSVLLLMIMSHYSD